MTDGTSRPLTAYALVEYLVKAGEAGLTTTDIALYFTKPATHQQRSNRASQILRTLSVNNYVRRGEREPTTMPGAGGAPVYRWYAMPQAAEYLANGDRAERARRAAERQAEWDRVSEVIVLRREQALTAARQEVSERAAAGTITKCWRYAKIAELRQVPCSLQEIGDVFGVTRERIRQIEASREDPCRCPACHDEMLRALSG